MRSGSQHHEEIAFWRRAPCRFDYALMGMISSCWSSNLVKRVSGCHVSRWTCRAFRAGASDIPTPDFYPDGGICCWHSCGFADIGTLADLSNIGTPCVCISPGWR
jgi:hypothetical protein